MNKKCIFYGAQSGNLWVNYRWEKGIWGSYLDHMKSVSEGEAIKMKVEGQTIYWEGEKQTKAKITDGTINDPSINWVPFIAMYSKGDIVSWK